MSGKMGRPPFEPTPAMRRKVEQCVAGGMSHEKIGLLLGIDRHTVEKHFRSELDRGSATMQAEAISLLLTAARKGNVAAAKKLYEISAATTAEKELAPWIDGEGASKQRVGKKEAALAAARAATEDTSDCEDLNGGINHADGNAG